MYKCAEAGWLSNFYTRLKVDSFGEKYQLSCIGLVEVIANFGHVLAPLLTELSIAHDINPIVSTNILRLTLGTIPVLFLATPTPTSTPTLKQAGKDTL